MFIITHICIVFSHTKQKSGRMKRREQLAPFLFTGIKGSTNAGHGVTGLWSNWLYIMGQRRGTQLPGQSFMIPNTNITSSYFVILEIHKIIESLKKKNNPLLLLDAKRGSVSSLKKPQPAASGLSAGHHMTCEMLSSCPQWLTVCASLCVLCDLTCLL